MSFLSSLVDKIKNIFVPTVVKTAEQVEVELAAVEAKVELAVAAVEKVAKKVPAKKTAAKKPAADKKPATKTKKPNIKIAK